MRNEKRNVYGNLTVIAEGNGYSKENCQLLTPDENKLKRKDINLTPMDVHSLF